MIERTDGELRRAFRAHGPTGGSGSAVPGSGWSGQWFVALGILALAAVAAGLVVGFRGWKARQLALAAYGAEVVAPTVEGLLAKVPPEIDREDWAAIVGESHDLLAALTSAGLLDRPAMEALRAEVADRVAAATAEGTAPDAGAVALNTLWNDLERRAGPVLTRAPKFQAPATLHELAGLAPPGVSNRDWEAAMLRTRALLASASDPARLSKDDRRALTEALAERLAGVKPGTARDALADAWEFGERLQPGTFHRPGLLKPIRADVSAGGDR